MPDQAFEKFWSTITIADAPSVPVDEFLSRVRPMTKTPLQPAGTQKKCKPSEAGTKVVKKNLFYVDPANPRPVPVWDNEWRQEADNRLREPIMSGIMRGLSPVTRDTLVCMAREFHLKKPTLLQYRDATQTRRVQSKCP